MAGSLPAGDPVPSDGTLPQSVLARAAGEPLSFYVHIPFCAHRCGYCDFNTYAPGDLSDDGIVSRYLAALNGEIDLAARVMAATTATVDTVFIGGGTPTLLSPTQLGSVVRRIDQSLGLASNAEITVEANPETLSPDSVGQLREQGFTRLSLGMQSVTPHVLATLERRHTPERALQVADWAHDAGFAHINVDLIYGTPGESLAEWDTTLRATLAAPVDHISAYSLIVEEGTPLARRIAAGRLPLPDDDDCADKYLLAEELCEAAGLVNYEVSNWAKPGAECRHNLAYWRSLPWWGAGAGAHSHVGGVRWWNVKHPRSYAERLEAATSPGYASETLTDEQRHEEAVLLQLRIRDGLALSELNAAECRVACRHVESGHAVIADDRLRLTLAGRLLADAITRDLLLG